MHAPLAQSRHAHMRAQQRGIPPLINQWLELYGERNYDGRGGICFFFSKVSRRALERAVGREPLRQLDRYLGCYKVVCSASGMTITCGHRTGSIRRR